MVARCFEEFSCGGAVVLGSFSCGDIELHDSCGGVASVALANVVLLQVVPPNFMHCGPLDEEFEETLNDKDAPYAKPTI